jgi:hypothetical protein
LLDEGVVHDIHFIGVKLIKVATLGSYGLTVDANHDIPSGEKIHTFAWDAPSLDVEKSQHILGHGKGAIMKPPTLVVRPWRARVPKDLTKTCQVGLKLRIMCHPSKSLGFILCKVDGAIEFLDQLNVEVLVECHDRVESKLLAHSICLTKVLRGHGHLSGVNGMLRDHTLLEDNIDLIEDLLCLVVEAQIRDTGVPRNEIWILPSQLLVLKIWHGLDGDTSLLATACGGLDIPLRRLLASRELGWANYFFVIINTILAPPLGTP